MSFRFITSVTLLVFARACANDLLAPVPAKVVDGLVVLYACGGFRVLVSLEEQELVNGTWSSVPPFVLCTTGVQSVSALNAMTLAILALAGLLPWRNYGPGATPEKPPMASATPIPW
jgi:hypothetical protein